MSRPREGAQVVATISWCGTDPRGPLLLEDTRMNETTPRLFDVDWSKFDPWKVTPVRHRIT